MCTRENSAVPTRCSGMAPGICALRRFRRRYAADKADPLQGVAGERRGAAEREERMKSALRPGKTPSIRRSRSASEPRDEAIQVEELNVYTRHGAAIGTPDI